MLLGGPHAKAQQLEALQPSLHRHSTCPLQRPAGVVWVVMWTTTGTRGHPRCVTMPVARQQDSAQVLCRGVSRPLTGLLFPGCGAVSVLLELSPLSSLGGRRWQAVLWGLLKLPCLLRGKLR